MNPYSAIFFTVIIKQNKKHSPTFMNPYSIIVFCFFMNLVSGFTVSENLWNSKLIFFLDLRLRVLLL
ncbi:hypothetical protein MtrunA17_Chr4g0048501 [Medicago truncatula]|uniref:Transmembrane protein n=1 Tax=Medicago truncatula TaxID=3880 RepID=A0A396IE48_MEDTR|nr:hypothetical protein MtrunA17_Chr4g0048501 [Medicago truncatula]